MTSKWWCLVSLTLSSAALAEGEPAGPALTVLDAVRTTLAAQAEIHLQEQSVVISKAAVRVATGQFDWNVAAAVAQRGETVPQTLAMQSVEVLPSGQPVLPGQAWSAVSTETTTWSLGVTKQFRWGMTVAPTLELNRIDQTGVNPANGQARVVFAVVQPLMKGRGGEAVEARERTAKIDEEASVLRLRHTIAQRIAATVQAYWAWRAARETVTILEGAKHRAETLLEGEQKLITAGEHPAADAKQLEANLADAHTALIDAERADVEAREALGVAMGISWEESYRLGAPSSELPDVDDAQIAEGAGIAELVRRSIDRRADHLAARLAVRSQETLAKAAKRDLDPQLNLEVDLGYNGLTEGNGVAPFITPVADRVSGLNFYGNLSFAYPVENNAARGALRQRDALVRQAAIVRDELARTIANAVSVSAQSLRRAVLSRRSADIAVVAYRGAVDNERKKLRAGLSTNIDVVLTESRMTNAELAMVRTRLKVAEALSELRFETGTLVDARGSESAVGLEELTVPPR